VVVDRPKHYFEGMATMLKPTDTSSPAWYTDVSMVCRELFAFHPRCPSTFSMYCGSKPAKNAVVCACRC
jgi:hypothetical protein